MKWKKILAWSCAGVLGSVVLAAAGAYCWLYSWSWGGMPPPHSSFTPAEVQQLQKLDSYLTGKGKQDFRAEAWEYAAMAFEISGTMDIHDQWRDEPEPGFSWWERQGFRYGTDYAILQSFGSARNDLHRLAETGSAAGANPYLAVSALHAQDAGLVRLIVSRGMDVNRVMNVGDATVRFLAEVLAGANLRRSEYLPVEQRLELLEWLVGHGLDINGVPCEYLVPMLEVTVMQTGDEQGQILEWLLRSGLQVDTTEIVGILLRYPTTLATLQRLIQEGLLPDVPAEFVSGAQAITPLAMVVSNITPSPDTVRWLLEKGHDVNALPRTVINGDDDSDVRPPMTPLDSLLSRLTYATPDDDTLEASLELLDLLLANGAQPGERTEELLPINSELKCRVVELLRRHGHHITAGDSPDNPCCIP